MLSDALYFGQAPRSLRSLSASLAMASMKTVAAIRRENLVLLAEELGSMEAVAARVDSTPVYLSQIRRQMPDSRTKRPRELGTELARRLERACEKPDGWMDQDHSSPEAAPELVVADVMHALGKDSRTTFDVLKLSITQSHHIAAEKKAEYLAALDDFARDVGAADDKQ
jgi:hypothetical protein